MKTFSIYIGSNNKTHVVEIMKAKEIISRRYDGFTYYFTKGYWKGETEDSVKFEIITMVALKELKKFYDFEVWCLMEDGQVIMTEEDLSDCCGAKIVNGRCFDCKDNVK